MRDGTNILMVLRQRKIWIRTAILFCVAFSPIAPVNLGFAQQKENSGNKLAAADAAGVTDSFKERVKQYVKLREQLEGKLPKLSTEAKPADIEAHQDAFGNLLRAARANAKPGDLFTTEVAQYFRLVIKDEFKGQRLKELRGALERGIGIVRPVALKVRLTVGCVGCDPSRGRIPARLRQDAKRRGQGRGCSEGPNATFHGAPPGRNGRDRFHATSVGGARQLSFRSSTIRRVARIMRPFATRA